jgi:Protein of unknown function DUF2625
MRPVAELISEDPAWPHIESWIAESSSEVVVLPTERARAEETLHRLQVTTGSTLGAMALETGGILIDHGWLRLLGSGSTELHGSLTNWNRLGDAAGIEPPAHSLIVGYDAVGGFFAVNGGEFEGERGHVFYFAPDTLEWESLERGYTDFLHWALTGDLAGFYADLRWDGWRDELAGASPDLGFALYPPPFTKEGRPLANVRRKHVPMRELWGLQQDYARQLADIADGTRVKFTVVD